MPHIRARPTRAYSPVLSCVSWRLASSSVHQPFFNVIAGRPLPGPREGHAPAGTLLGTPPQVTLPSGAAPGTVLISPGPVTPAHALRAHLLPQPGAGDINWGGRPRTDRLHPPVAGGSQPQHDRWAQRPSASSAPAGAVSNPRPHGGGSIR
ncbi:hypothetical protein NDU88_002826 [Pleurodeles waltl]|uniref:Uncharacterized protein n=1 Tax=Pleurodeles waltl TaxID=8319 RepID=A0AAV7MNV1_PLEWA|nr:hypothetical protein NDU88_002826 [Pleurodeles waltl]